MHTYKFSDIKNSVLHRYMRKMEKLEIANLLLKRGEMFDILFHEAEEELWLGYVLLPFKFARVTVSTAGKEEAFSSCPWSCFCTECDTMDGSAQPFLLLSLSLGRTVVDCHSLWRAL